MPFQNWPYSDLGNINLDWILARVKEAWEKADNAEEIAENLRTFVNDYFDNLDVQQEINEKIDNMVLDGSFEDVLLQFVPAIIDTWLTAHITNPASPPLDSTLTLTNAAAQAARTGLLFSRSLLNQGNLADGTDLNTLVADPADPGKVNGIWVLVQGRTYPNMPDGWQSGFLRVYSSGYFTVQELHSTDMKRCVTRVYGVVGVNEWAWRTDWTDASMSSSILPSCDLNDIHGSTAIYLLISNNTYQNTPDNSTTGIMFNLAVGDWTYSIFFSLFDHKMWTRTWGVAYIGTELVHLWRNDWALISGGGGGTYNNEYVNNVYNNTYNVTATPTITTDTNNFLAASGNNADRKNDIETMLATGYCKLGAGDFYVSGIDVPAYATLEGCGNKTRIYLLSSVTDGYAVKLKTYSSVRNLMISGQIAQYTPVENMGNRHGIVWQGTADGTPSQVWYRGMIDNVTIYNMHGAGIYCYNVGGSVASNLLVNNVYVYWSDAGVAIPYYSEYHSFTNVSVNGCWYGAIVNGGNCLFSACNFSGNKIGLLMDNSNGQSRNNGHGTFNACTFNHNDNNNGVAMRLIGIGNGEIFTGVNVFYGTIEILRSVGIQFGNCVFATSGITVVDSKAVQFSDCMVRTASEVVYSGSGNTGVKFVNCQTWLGAEYQPA